MNDAKELWELIRGYDLCPMSLCEVEFEDLPKDRQRDLTSIIWAFDRIRGLRKYDN